MNNIKPCYRQVLNSAVAGQNKNSYAVKYDHHHHYSAQLFH